MHKKKDDTEDALRPHYDLNQLEIVAVGPGWRRHSANSVRAGTNASERYYPSRLASAKRLFSSSLLDRDLLMDFFMTFARAEYALKEAGYLSKQNPPRVQWDRFASKIGEGLLAADEPAVKHAIEYLDTNPPAKQVVKGKSLIWEPRKCDKQRTDPIFLIRSITTVRNNLFHGSKKIHGPLAERDFRLLLSCLNLLSFALTLDKDVLHFFKDVPAVSDVA